jgi:hypothetical protein
LETGEVETVAEEFWGERSRLLEETDDRVRILLRSRGWREERFL